MLPLMLPLTPKPKLWLHSTPTYATPPPRFAPEMKCARFADTGQWLGAHALTNSLNKLDEFPPESWDVHGSAAVVYTPRYAIEIVACTSSKYCALTAAINCVT